MLPTIGTANGILAVKLIGVDTGVELFLLPCVPLGAILFRPGERFLTLIVTAFPFAAYLFLDGIVGAPLAEYSASEYRSIISMQAFSVASLLALIGFTFPSKTEGARLWRCRAQTSSPTWAARIPRPTFIRSGHKTLRRTESGELW